MEAIVGGTEFQYSTSGIPKLIKVVGVGGGGGNAVTHMYTTGEVSGVSFLLCNTDQQALNNSEVPNKLVIGQGLGAGNIPDVARQAAEESEEAIRTALCDGETRMVFITAGMGGGTGTGASPVVGRIAREAGLLVVGIVTIPFVMEGANKVLKALKGVQELRKNVDALLVINNEKLINLYPTFDLDTGLKYADEMLTKASKGITDIVNVPGRINLDFADVQTTLINGGVAIINTGYAKGARRVDKAIKSALHSPLFNNNKVSNAKKLLYYIYSPVNNPLTMSELGEIREFVESLTTNVDVIWGYAMSDSEEMAITILASGFDYKETERHLRLAMDTKGKKAAVGYGDDEIAAEDQKLIEEMYGPGVVGAGSSKKTHPLVLSIHELDNDDLIDELEHTPAIKRTAQVAEAIRTRYRTHRSASDEGFSMPTTRAEKPSRGVRQQEEGEKPRSAIAPEHPPRTVHTPEPQSAPEPQDAFDEDVLYF